MDYIYHLALILLLNIISPAKKGYNFVITCFYVTLL